ncbi:hypothetical protein E1B28_013703 [Marasmius oreades]|uniref:Uncharacterized protein n=1 Tax=Marasmius oreades TaxID=181124 RepID=A0A9P7RQD0_9AGAR|nr:uncharacterized protein E1B28_013703 [Marasmius oreades]KAG7087762.1 hypothetical protein E1B28_013703 [Marasmius oreades]
MPPANGYERLNRSTLRVLTKAMDLDPSADLESTLKRIYTTYPKLRVNEDDRDKRRRENEGKLLTPPPPVLPMSSRASPLPAYIPELGTSSQIIYPLDATVLSYLSLTGPSEEDSPIASRVAKSLLTTLNAQEPLVMNGSTQILSLGVDVLVKASHMS